MPYLQHQGVGDHVMYARSDHSIPVPRPGFDQSVGVENACQKCHRDKDLAWQENKMREWYGTLKPAHPAIANAIKAAAISNASEVAQLLLDPQAKHPMAQMAGLISFTKRFLRPDMDAIDPTVLAMLKAFATNVDLDLKSMALAALHVSFNRQPETRAFIAAETSKLGSLELAVRNRRAVIADYLGGEFASRGELSPAIVCFQRSLDIKPDNIVTISHLALAYLRAGESARAVAALETGIRLRPEKAVLRFQLAQTYVQLQRIPEAIGQLEHGLEYAPEDQTARQMLEQLRGP
jgi:tetratricopeptide (TPR) repeat protein